MVNGYNQRVPLTPQGDLEVESGTYDANDFPIDGQLIVRIHRCARKQNGLKQKPMDGYGTNELDGRVK